MPPPRPPWDPGFLGRCFDAADVSHEIVALLEFDDVRRLLQSCRAARYYRLQLSWSHVTLPACSSAGGSWGQALKLLTPETLRSLSLVTTGDLDLLGPAIDQGGACEPLGLVLELLRRATGLRVVTVARTSTLGERPRMSDFLRALPELGLWRLHINDTVLSAAGAGIYDAIGRFRELRSLCLRSAALLGFGKQLAAVLQRISHLETLCLSANVFDEEDIDSLVAVVHRSRTLLHVDVGGCRTEPPQASRKLVDLAVGGPNIEVACLADCGLTCQAMFRLYSWVFLSHSTACRRLRALNLSGNRELVAGSLDAQVFLCRVVQHAPALRCLDLGGVSLLCARGYSAFPFDLMRHTMTRLQELLIAGTDIFDGDVVPVIQDDTQAPSSLTYLDASGGLYFCRSGLNWVLQYQGTSLQHLVLQSVRFAFRDAELFEEAMRVVSTNLEVLNLCDAGLGVLHARFKLWRQVLRRSLRRLLRVTDLYLHRNALRKASVLYRALRHLGSRGELTTLGLSGNRYRESSRRLLKRRLSAVVPRLLL